MTASISTAEFAAFAPSPAPAHAAAPRLSIPLTLGVLVAACLIPALVALGAMSYVDYRFRETALYGETIANARTMMALVDRDLETVESGLRVLASGNVATDGEMTRLQERLRNAPKSPAIGAYAVVDRDGRVRSTTTSGPARPDGELATRLKAVFTTGKPVLTGVFPGPADRPPVVAMGVPIPRGDGVGYTLAAVLAPETLFASARASLPAGWIAAIIDQDGDIVARTPDAARYVGQRATPSLLAALDGRSEGTSETMTKDDVAMLTAFSRSSRGDWTVAVGAPRALLVGSLHRSIAWIAVAALGVLGFVLWFAFRVSHAVTRAVDGLVEPAMALGSGRPVDVQPTRFREIDAVGRAIRQASRRRATAQHHAYHAPLTNLRNRTLFDEMAMRQIAQAYRDGAQFAILAIDLDGFKAVNDQHGHAAGDLVLKTVADRIMGLVRGSDVVSRRGGDEFAVMLVDVDGARTRHIAEKLLDALSQPYPGVEPSVSASIGVARYPHDATTLHDLLERADEALYAAKDAGKRRVTGDF